MIATPTEMELYLRGDWAGFEFKKPGWGLVTVTNQHNGLEWYCICKLPNSEIPHVFVADEIRLLHALGSQLLAKIKSGDEDKSTDEIVEVETDE